MSEKYLLVNLYDKKSKKIAEVLGNKTCKKIIEHLSEIKEASEKDISDALKMRINTIEYNLKKLIFAGFIEKTKNFFWSKKGKKIPMYKLAKKHILISSKTSELSSKLKSILPVAIISGIGALIIGQTFSNSDKVNVAQDSGALAVETASGSFTEGARIMADNANLIIQTQTFPIWAWFLAGTFLAILIFTLINWRKL